MPVLVDIEEILKKKRERKRRGKDKEETQEEIKTPSNKYKIRLFNIKDEDQRFAFEKLINELMVEAEKEKVSNIQVKDYADYKGNIIKTVEWFESQPEEGSDGE